MVRVEETITIDAPPPAVWAVMADVERWPEWAPHVRSVAPESGDAFGPGSRWRLDMDGGPAAVWTVTNYEEGQAFTWESASPGVKTRAYHVIDPQDGGSRVTLGIVATGIGATLFGFYIARISRRNVRSEADGLKRRCEAKQ
jgi:uncharacterized membrane protein